LEACVASGARRAEPGEFTRRAYLNGKMDLVQAEAVLDLVGGRSRALHEAAVHQIERGLSRRLDELREAILEIEALLVHHIDFPEEDDPPASTGQIAARARLLVEGLARLPETAPEGELLRDGALTVLAGVPNAGKSSLFNALLGRERAIVTEVAGTTRDAVESVVSLGGFPFRLVDTAGLRRGGERVESLGIEVARRYLARADLILFCAEWGRELTPEEEAFLDEERDAPVVLVRTKADEQGAGGASASGEGAPEGEDGVPGGPVAVSTVTGRGLAGLRALLPRLVFRGLVSAEGEAPLLTRARQARGVDRAREEIEAFAGALESGVPPELAATHLGSAETALEEVLGVVVRDEVLDRVFREFCVGK
ncbi:MAG TPA: tRNA modification GTPase, partial [Longimicrobiales bacterium]|nr:tRNA modification GTPase [Longimicrobiales bacterium]